MALASNNKPQLHVINIFVTVALLLVTSTRTENGSGNIQLILVNNCAESIWPGLLGTAGHPTPQSGGFHLAPADEAAFDVPVGWSGRVWPRRGCSFDDRERGLCAQSHGTRGNIQLILVNNCAESIWPGLLGTAGHPTPQSGGFHLAPADEAAFDVPVGWSGRVWPRRGCSFDDRERGLCATGDCGGVLRCDGRPGATPATVVEMTLGTPKSPLHFYDVSLVDGFNAPVSMAPVGGGAGCGVAGCQADLNVCCPSALEVRDREGRVAGCRSACRAMGGDRYCCTGDYASPDKCRPTIFAHVFKAVCPKAYSYAYDDATSLNRCKASRYLITFCPPPTSRK